MQFLVDTQTDDPAELIDVAGILIRAARQRMPDDTAAPTIHTNPSQPAGTVSIGVKLAPTEETPNPAEVFAGGVDPTQVFGKGPLPATAIATDMPESFTPPAATGPAVPGVSAAAAQDAASSTTTTPTSSTAPQTLAAASDPEDKDGYKWDKRIHSESKALNKDNTWRIKRGVSPELVAQVKAEQRANEKPVDVPAGTMPVESPALPTSGSVPPVPADVPAPPASEPATVVAVVPQVPAVPAVPAASAATTPPPPPATAGGLPVGYQVGVEITDFKNLMAFKATPAMQAGRIKSTDLVEICKRLGLGGLHDLVPTHAKIPEVAKEIDKVMGVG